MHNRHHEVGIRMPDHPICSLLVGTLPLQPVRGQLVHGPMPASSDRVGLPTVFVLEGGYAAAELGTNAVNVLEGFEG